MARKQIPGISAKHAYRTLDDFLTSTSRSRPIPDHLRKIVERERDALYQALGNHETLAAPGPVLAILTDPPTATVSDADLPGWVRTVMHTTKAPAPLRTVVWIALGALAGFGLIAAYLMGIAMNPMFVLMIGGLWAVVALEMPRREGPFHQITFDDALALAQYRRQMIGPKRSHLRLNTPTGQRDQRKPIAEQPARTTGRTTGRAKRIAEVRAALAELDQEWLEYELDLRAWFLTKPQLRNNNDPTMAAYRDAYVTLRNKAAELSDDATEDQIDDAQRAARTALKTWHDANALALQRGVNDLSPSEEAALTRLYGLVSQLNDRSTPKAMWPQLITAITRTMDKLTTVPFTLDYIAGLPVIEARTSPAPPPASELASLARDEGLRSTPNPSGHNVTMVDNRWAKTFRSSSDGFESETSDYLSNDTHGVDRRDRRVHGRGSWGRYPVRAQHLHPRRWKMGRTFRLDGAHYLRRRRYARSHLSAHKRFAELHRNCGAQQAGATRRRGPIQAEC